MDVLVNVYYFVHAWHSQFDMLQYYFLLSKYYEYGDTLLLYMSGKVPMRLQKYHHVGAVICWHLGYVYQLDSIWIPTFINAFVHTWMYGYYLGTILHFNVRWMRHYITRLQLLQMIFGTIIGNILYIPLENNIRQTVMGVSNAYVTVLTILFLDFYRRSYRT